MLIRELQDKVDQRKAGERNEVKLLRQAFDMFDSAGMGTIAVANTAAMLQELGGREATEQDNLLTQTIFVTVMILTPRTSRLQHIVLPSLILSL